MDALVRQEGSELNGRDAVDAGQHRLEQHDQRDRGDDLHRRGCTGQPERDALQQQGADEADQDHGEERGDRPREPDRVPEGVEDVCRRGRLRTDGEVEDARGLVGQDKAECRKSVDRPSASPVTT